MPAAHTLEGLYIDDHLVMHILPGRKARRSRQKFRDEELIAKSRNQYKHLGLPVSKRKKQFTKSSNSTAWGTNVDGESGRVGVATEKLKGIGGLVVEVCNLKKVIKKILPKVAGLLVHPAMHRRLLMSLFQEVYQLIGIG